VSQFTLALQRIGIFGQVRLIKTNREAYLSGQAIHFAIEGTLQDRPGGAG
jgi:hypothetical protein